MQWTVVAPLKDLSQAKSRLLGATVGVNEHRELVQAMRTDALAACAGARIVARIVVVTAGAAPAADAHHAHDAPLHLVPDPPEPGLNAAVSAGVKASKQWPDDGIAVVVSDLPCLTAAALDDVLEAAAAHRWAFVEDRQGTGTTVLTARAGAPLTSQFGVDSAQRHRTAGAVALPASARVRTDVDTAADLTVARAVGLGPATTAVLQRLDPTTG